MLGKDIMFLTLVFVMGCLFGMMMKLLDAQQSFDEPLHDTVKWGLVIGFFMGVVWLLIAILFAELSPIS